MSTRAAGAWAENENYHKGRGGRRGTRTTTEGTEAEGGSRRRKRGADGTAEGAEAHRETSGSPKTFSASSDLLGISICECATARTRDKRWRVRWQSTSGASRAGGRKGGEKRRLTSTPELNGERIESRLRPCVSTWHVGACRAGVPRPRVVWQRNGLDECIRRDARRKVSRDRTDVCAWARAGALPRAGGNLPAGDRGGVGRHGRLAVRSWHSATAGGR